MTQKTSGNIATSSEINSNFIFYTSPNGQISIEVLFTGETIWASQKQMAEIFDVDRTTIGKHIKNVFETGELNKESNVQKMHIANSDKPVVMYNLDVIISVGYRVNSIQATAFRKWATKVLREYMIKGFALDDERLKNGAHFGKDYFDELLERIREIRISERRLYLKVTDIFATASDYDKTSALTKEFFAFVQNKLHYAVAGGTAAEIIYNRADRTKDHMGLHSWSQMPDGKVMRRDVTVAKNYLDEAELKKLQLAVTAFLDIAEARASRQIPTSMAKWIEIMDGYLDLNDYPKLQGVGRVKKSQADEKALAEYAEFRIRQDEEYIGDFEREVQEIGDNSKPVKDSDSA